MKVPTIKPDDLTVNLLTAFITDVGNHYQITTRDQNLDTRYLLRRLECEGIGFATKTLPSFGKHFDSCLKKGIYTPTSILKKDRRGVLPLFLRGLTCRVFDVKSGIQLANPDCNAVRLIRQVSYLFYKLDVPYAKELEDECIAQFVATDMELANYRSFGPAIAGCAYDASLVIKQLFRDFDEGDITPRPGPGQTADRVPSYYRYEPHVLYAALHKKYNYSTYFYLRNDKHLPDRASVYRRLPVLLSGLSKLALVPKDSRGPRIICMEPHEYMWLQQGLGRAMMEHMERHPLTRGHVNFTDQTINGRLALNASKSQRHATLDMKEASDRISTALVDVLFGEVPKLRDALLALSTRHIKLPSDELMRKNKFAPMGSALCFPVMSIVHYALGLACIMQATGCSLREAQKDLYVYGDDLIVANRHAKYLFDAFPDYGLKFNVDKSCTTGFFRESCGVDAFLGIDVTPQRIKTCAFSPHNGPALASSLATFHGFFNRGLWTMAKQMQTWIVATWGNLPCVSKRSKALGWIIPRTQILDSPNRWKWNKHLQCKSITTRVIRTKKYASMIGCWERLIRNLVHTKVGSSADVAWRGHTEVVWSQVLESSL